jgi:hypothetical protein
MGTTLNEPRVFLDCVWFLTEREPRWFDDLPHLVQKKRDGRANRRVHGPAERGAVGGLDGEYHDGLGRPEIQGPDESEGLLETNIVGRAAWSCPEISFPKNVDRPGSGGARHDRIYHDEAGSVRHIVEQMEAGLGCADNLHPCWRQLPEVFSHNAAQGIVGQEIIPKTQDTNRCASDGPL